LQSLKNIIMRHFLKLLGIAILFCSCTKNLDLAPKDTISDATFWRNEADFKLAANGLYNSLEGFDFGDTEADLAYNDGNDISKGTYMPAAVSADWTNAYVNIRTANNIIDKGASFTDAGVKKYVSEAKFFRAYNYWRLFRLYGGVPLITKVLDVSDAKLYTPRASRKETVDFMLNDLSEAVADLPSKADQPNEDVGRINKGAADGLKARIALFEGTWEKYRNEAGYAGYLDIAISASNGIMNSGDYALYSAKGEQSYRYLFIEEGDDSPESILDHRYERNISGHSFSYQIDHGYLATKKLADMYLCKDGLPITSSTQFNGYNTVSSEFDNRDPRMTMTMIIPGTATLRPFHAVEPVINWPNSPQRNGNTGYITYKFLSEDVTGNAAGETGNSYGFDHHIIRYAEILLIYAEALYEKNDAISDVDLDKSINVIRARVNMPPMTNAFVSSNGMDMKTEIRRERNVELAFEDFRYDDIRRWKTAETEMVQDIKGIKIKGTDWQSIAPYDDASWQARTDGDGFLIAEPASGRFFDPSKHYLRPLPTREIALYAGKLEQNPGW
jgi:starch-binding outer membrane protein, SusD/RagB family